MKAEVREELEALDRAATPGPWQAGSDEVNAKLTAAMRNALPELLALARKADELERHQEFVAFATAMIESERKRAEDQRASAEHRLLVNADLQRKLDDANAKLKEALVRAETAEKRVTALEAETPSGRGGWEKAGHKNGCRCHECDPSW